MLNCLSWYLCLILYASSCRAGNKWCITWYGLCMMRWWDDFTFYKLTMWRVGMLASWPAAVCISCTAWVRWALWSCMSTGGFQSVSFSCRKLTYPFCLELVHLLSFRCAVYLSSLLWTQSLKLLSNCAMTLWLPQLPPQALCRTAMSSATYST